MPINPDFNVVFNKFLIHPPRNKMRMSGRWGHFYPDSLLTSAVFPMVVLSDLQTRKGNLNIYRGGNIFTLLDRTFLAITGRANPDLFTFNIYKSEYSPFPILNTHYCQSWVLNNAELCVYVEYSTSLIPTNIMLNMHLYTKCQFCVIGVYSF